MPWLMRNKMGRGPLLFLLPCLSSKISLCFTASSLLQRDATPSLCLDEILFFSFLVVSKCASFLLCLTNHHKIGGLKQHTFILLELWNSEGRNQFPRPEGKVSAALVPPRSSRLEPMPLPFPVSRGPAVYLA